MGLKGKVVIISGGGSGLGREIAYAVAAEGAKVFICGRDSRALASVCRVILAGGAPCAYTVVDVTNPAKVARFIQKIVRGCGRIDVVVNNAGWAGESPKLLHQTTDIEYRRYFQTNVDSVFYFLRASIPIMLKQNSGVIINISSTAGRDAHPRLPIYSATKFAVQGLTQATGKMLDDLGGRVRCIAVAPGGMNTPMRVRIFGKEDAGQQQNPSQVASIVKSVINGEIKTVNGGTVEVRNGSVVSTHSPF